MARRSRKPTELVDMAKLMSFHGAEPILLYQIAGPGGPRRVRLLPIEETIFGRNGDCQVVLDEETVSRRHARILFVDRKPELLDLESGRGTFLNGKQVQRAFLTDGDQIQIGGSVFQVAMANRQNREPVSDAGVAQLQSLLQKSQSSAISGSLSEIRLSSLLQVLESDRVTGTLVIRQVGREGRIHIDEGTIRHAILGRARGVKALYRLMIVEEGSFELFTPGRSPEYDTVEGDLHGHLLEAMRQKDEFEVYRKELPDGGSTLTFNPDVSIHASRVPAVVYEVMAAVGLYKSVDNILEFCQLPDFEICRVLLVLLKHKLLVVEV